MRNQDEFREWNKEKNTANKVILTLVILAVFIVGIGCFGKIMQENSSITLTSQATVQEIEG